MATPNFEMMWKAFPDHVKYPTLSDLHNYIGGTLKKNIGVPGFGPAGNTCAVRMSRALNYGSFPISAKLIKSLQLSTMAGADGMLYIFRVRELRTYLNAALAVTPSKVSKNFASAFAQKRGIVSFEVMGWNDASGHIALWDKSAFREPHDDYRSLKDDPKTTVKEATTKSMSLWAV